MKKVKNAIYFFGLSVLMLGCSEIVEPPTVYQTLTPTEAYAQLPQNMLTIKHGTLAAQALLDKSNGAIRKDVPLIIASFVDSDDLKYTTGFGRMLTQQFSTQFVNNGYKVVELLLRDNVYITEKGGEFLLSREVKDLIMQHNAQAAVVGTYIPGADTVFVTAKIVDLSSNVILSSLDFSLPLDSNVRKMLDKSAFVQMSDKN